jgi:serine/threonine protein kinase
VAAKAGGGGGAGKLKAQKQPGGSSPAGDAAAKTDPGDGGSACGNYLLDATAPFGAVCTCGKSKTEHAEAAFQFGSSKAAAGAKANVTRAEARNDHRRSEVAADVPSKGDGTFPKRSIYTGAAKTAKGTMPHAPGKTMGGEQGWKGPPQPPPRRCAPPPRGRGKRIAALLALVGEQRAATAPALKSASRTDSAGEALGHALCKLREALRKPREGDKERLKKQVLEQGALERERDTARRALIDAMQAAQDSAGKVMGGLGAAYAAVQVALEDLRLEGGGEDEEDESKEPAAVRSLGGTVALLVQLAKAAGTLERCSAELPRLRKYEASPPNANALDKAARTLNRAKTRLRQARENYELDVADGDVDEAGLQKLRDGIGKANEGRRAADATLCGLRDAMLESIAHYPEVKQMIAQDVPDHLVHLWKPNQQLSDFDNQTILQVGRYRVHKVGHMVGAGDVPVRFSAVKEFECGKGQRKYFLREMDRLDELRGPNIMQIEALFMEGKSFFMQMPFCSGGNIDDFIKQQVSNGVMKSNRLRRLLRQSLDGIVHVHTKGVVHADLKPANILVDDDGNPRLTDFEMSRKAVRSFDLSRMGGGTQGFLAKELLCGDVEATMPSDMFAFGVTLDRCLSAARPLRAAGDLGASAGLDALADLVANLKEDDPSKRLTALQARQHSYFTTNAEEVDDLLLGEAVRKRKALEERQREVENLGLKLQGQAVENQRRFDAMENKHHAAIGAAKVESERNLQVLDRMSEQKLAAEKRKTHDAEEELKKSEQKLKAQKNILEAAQFKVDQTRFDAEKGAKDAMSKMEQQKITMREERRKAEDQLREQRRAAVLEGEQLKRALVAAGQYEWLDEHGAWNPYPPDLNAKIISAAAHSAVCSYDRGGQTYNITTRFPMFQKNVKYNTARHVRLTGGPASEKFMRETPTYWQPGTTPTGFDLVELDQSKPDMKAAFDDVVALVTREIALDILSVSVVQDPSKWIAYNLKKAQLGARLATGANERRVVHGGSELSIRNIARQGFIREYNSASVYGKGTYFARDMSYSASDRYSPPNANGEKFAFLARVLVGEPCIGSLGMVMPTAKRNGSLHDSMVDRLQNPSIFVLSSGADDHGYPDFMIKFKRK